jgi:hypothetical protein
MATDSFDELKKAAVPLRDSLASGINALLSALVDAITPDPFARTTDPVRHPEGREDPTEYA